MSRMSKYLLQICILEKVKLDVSGAPVMNEYSELEYELPQPIACRREKFVRDVEISTGAVVKSSTQYFTDVEISINDKLDSKVVLSIEELTNEMGTSEGYRSIT